MALDGPGIAAIIAASGGTIVAIIGAFRIQRNSAKPDEEKPEPAADRPPLPPVPATFDGDQILEFLKEQRAELVALRARDEAKDAKIGGLTTQLDAMGIELQTALNTNAAFGRWIPVIYRWSSNGANGSFPLPESAEDLVLLRDFVPRG